LPTNVAEHSENRLFRSDSFVSLDGGGGGDNVVPSKLFKHAWECVVFAALCLDKLCDDSLMVGLGEKTISFVTLSQPKYVQIFYSLFCCSSIFLSSYLYSLILF
jgi:hypothetical protein